MLRLDLPREPYRLDLGSGVTVTVRPLDTAVMAAARATVERTLREWREDRERLRAIASDPSALPDLDDPDARAGLAEALLIKALARQAIVAWEGVLAVDGDTPAPVHRPRTVGDLMAFWDIADRSLTRYTAAYVRLDAEKNV